MRHIMKCFCIMPLVACVLSCDFFNEDNGKNVSADSIAQLADSIKSMQAAQNSINCALLNKVDSITTKLNEANRTIELLKSQIKQQDNPESPWNVVSIAAALLSIVAIAISIIKDVRNRYMSCSIDGLNSRIKGLEHKMTPSSKQGGSDMNEIRDLKARVEAAEASLRKHLNESKSVAAPSAPVEPSEPVTVEAETRTEYCSSVSGMFLTNSKPSKQENSVYIITFTDEAHGTFEIVSFSQLRQLNGWEGVVEVKGNAVQTEATGHRVIKQGLCEKRGVLWMVTRKLQIEIYK